MKTVEEILGIIATAITRSELHYQNVSIVLGGTRRGYEDDSETIYGIDEYSIVDEIDNLSCEIGRLSVCNNVDKKLTQIVIAFSGPESFVKASKLLDAIDDPAVNTERYDTPEVKVVATTIRLSPAIGEDHWNVTICPFRKSFVTASLIST